MTLLQQDDIILQAALRFGPDYLYTIRYGTVGLTLYVETNNKEEARMLRKEIPMSYEGLRTIVIYTEKKKN